MSRLMKLTLVVCAIALSQPTPPLLAQFPLPAPILRGHVPTYAVSARLSGGVLRVDGSDISKDRSGNLAGEMILISEATVMTSRRVRVGTRSYTMRVATRMVQVRAGVDRNRDGSLRILGDNPFPGGLVLQVPVREVDFIQMNMGGGFDRVIVDDVGASMNALLGADDDYFFATSCFGGTRVDGGHGSDDIDVSDSGAATIDGGEGDDDILGSIFDDILFGRGGEDTIRALGGHDFIDAGDDDDVVLAGTGHDIVQGGAGADILDGENGVDIMISSSIDLPPEEWPAPDANGIIFNTGQLRDLLSPSHRNDFERDMLRGGPGDDFIVWFRFQDIIDINDPFSFWIQFLFGAVARG